MRNADELRKAKLPAGYLWWALLNINIDGCFEFSFKTVKSQNYKLRQ